jgi:hypothetical protein
MAGEQAYGWRLERAVFVLEKEKGSRWGVRWVAEVWSNIAPGWSRNEAARAYCFREARSSSQ